MADPRTADARRVNADLHCHSVVSDGTLAPAAIVERAHRNGVAILALTDHDEVGGLAEAQARAEALGLRFVPGVEVSERARLQLNTRRCIEVIAHRG